MPSNIASVGTLLDTLPQSASYRSPHASRSDFSRSLDHDPSHGPLAFDLTERSSVYERRPSGLYDRSSGLYKIPGVFRQGSVGDTLPTWGSVNKPRQRNISVGALPSFDAFDGRAAVGSTGLPPSHVDDPLGAPSLGRAMLHAEQLLPHLPHSPEHLFPLNTTFEAFGVGIYTYMKVVRRAADFFAVLFLMSMSNMVSNFYGGALDREALSHMSYRMWFFTVTSIGNSGALTPSYGVMEFLLSSVMVVGLYRIRSELQAITAEAILEQTSPADFAIRLEGLPADTADERLRERITAALHDFVPGLEVVHVGLARHDRALIVASNEHAAAAARLGPLEVDLAVAERLLEAQPTEAMLEEQLGGPKGLRRALARRAALREAAAAERDVVDRTEATMRRLLSEPGWQRCCGVGFVSFHSKVDALQIFEQIALGKPLQMQSSGGGVSDAPLLLRVSRPPEPSDVLWENLPCSRLECGLRQLLVTLIMSGVSMAGTVLIVGFSYASPHLLPGYGLDEAIGTTFIIIGYLLVFILVPRFENTIMRHKSFNQKEVSTVLKLVFFQVLATVCTASVYVRETGNAFNRDWYLNAAPLITNGMMVDFFMINVVVQGLNLGKLIRRKLIAPKKLTQFEMNEAYSVKADLYVVDRLQILTKFAVLALMYSAALPVLYLIVHLVMLLANYIDRYNLLRVFVAPPHSDDSVVRSIVVYVLPLAILFHLLVTYLLFTQLHAGQHDITSLEAWKDWFQEILVAPSRNASKAAWADYWSSVTGVHVSANSSASYTLGHLDQLLLDEEENASRITVRLSLWVHTPLVLYYLCRELRRECGYTSELLSLPFLKLRLSRLYDAIDHQMDGVLAGAGAPETAPKAPNLTRSLSGDKPWRMYEASYTQVLRDHQTIYEPPALPSRLQAEFGETQFEMQPEDTRRHALPPLVGAAREGTQEGSGCDGASARALAPAPASMASEVMAFLHRVFGAAPQAGCSGRGRSGPDPVGVAP